jgi:M6 family metalloprotease-like protein
MAGDHFYTISSAERDNAFAFLNYLEEGTACFVQDAPAAGTTPLFRLYNAGTGDHFYTISQPEASKAVATYGYQSEGVACHVYPAATAGTVPLHRLLNPNNGDHFYTTSQTEANNAVFSFGYQSEGVACYVFDAPSPGATPLYRMVQVSSPSVLNPTQSPWAVLLCKFKGDASEPPAPQGVLPLRTAYERFFTDSNQTFNAVKFFSDMSHGKLDLTGSQVLGWYEIGASITGRTNVGDPILDKTQGEIVAMAKQAAKDAGVAIDKFTGVVVIMNEGTGWAQGTLGWMAADWRRVDGRNLDGTIGVRGIGAGNGVEVFGQEMGHGYGLDHSRMNGSNADYQDQWDIMSTAANTFAAVDTDWDARGPGMNAWNMRSRGWLDETRIWKGPANTDFSETIQLRPLHQRNLPGYLGAELRGIGNHSPYLVEFRVPELWDAGLPSAAVLVHRFSGAEENGQVYSPGLLGQALGTHSYIMSGQNGAFSLADGDFFEAGNGPLVRMKVLGIDRANRLATIQVCYSSSPKVAPTVRIKTSSAGDCIPPVVEGAVAKFTVTVDNLRCSQSYNLTWSVVGASPVSGYPLTGPSVSILVPDPSVAVTVVAVARFDDGTVASDSFAFNSISQSDAGFRELVCKLLRERLKPIPWWEWEPERMRSIAASYSRDDLSNVIRGMEALLQRLRSM